MIVAFVLVAAPLSLLGGVPTVVRALFAVPLILLLPGLALLEARRPRARVAGERLLFAIAVSTAIAVVGGLVLDWTPLTLDAPTWIGLFAGVSIVAGSVGIVRNRDSSPRAGLPHGRRLAGRLLLAALALVITGGALALARAPLPARTVQGYTALWILPAKGGAPAARIGVQSAELRRTGYRLEVREAGRVVRTRRFGLEPGETFRTDVPVAGTGHGPAVVGATLFRDGGSVPYRQVDLRGSP